MAVGKMLTATLSEAMDPLTISSSTFTVAGPGNTPVTGFVAYAGPSFAATFLSAHALAPNTIYTGTLTTGAKDLAGNALAVDYVWTFTTGATPDITPPMVLSTDPGNSATGVPPNKLITATFTEALNPATITTATVALRQGTTPVSGAVTYAGTTALFTPAGILAPGTVYTATITTGVTDLAGNALPSNYTWSFTTGAGPDIIRPTVTFTDPVNSATDVGLNKKIAAVFSEAMKSSTITTTTFTLLHGTTPVSGTVTYAGTTALFTPATALAPEAAYTATITADATDTAGNELASSYVSNFTTGVAPDTTPPTVISTDPANSATGVALNTTIEPTFSEAMDPLTITTATFTLRQGTTSVSGTVTYAGTTALFVPAGVLTANSVYTAAVSTGVTDLAGNALASTYTWSFTTGATPDVVRPTVLSTDPVNGATDVALSKIIKSVFSEAMDQSTITTATVTVTGLGGALVTGTVT
jgi:hypothetical protein